MKYHLKIFNHHCEHSILEFDSNEEREIWINKWETYYSFYAGKQRIYYTDITFENINFPGSLDEKPNIKLIENFINNKVEQGKNKWNSMSKEEKEFYKPNGAFL